VQAAMGPKGQRARFCSMPRNRGKKNTLTLEGLVATLDLQEKIH
jgi:hypothetical protein